MSISIQPPDWKSCCHVGWLNGFWLQSMSPFLAGSIATVANGEIVSFPAMISSAVALLKAGSPPHALAASRTAAGSGCAGDLAARLHPGLAATFATPTP